MSSFWISFNFWKPILYFIQIEKIFFSFINQALTIVLKRAMVKIGKIEKILNVNPPKFLKQQLVVSFFYFKKHFHYPKFPNNWPPLVEQHFLVFTDGGGGQLLGTTFLWKTKQFLFFQKLFEKFFCIKTKKMFFLKNISPFFFFTAEFSHFLRTT